MLYYQIRKTPVIALGIISDPTICLGSDGSIQITGLLASTSYNLGYTDDGNPITGSLISDAFGNIVINSLNAGVYDDIILTIVSCQSNVLGPVTLDPATPTLSATGTNPATCGGNGSIAFTFTNVPDGNYIISYDAGTFANVAVSSGAATVVAAKGTYDNLNITVSGCTSVEDVDITLTDPPTPTLSATGTNPATCGGNGSIAFTFTNVPDGNYTISYDAGTFANVAVSSGAATVVAAKGTYDNLSITVSGCTSAEDVDITLTDPPTPTLSATGTNPATCGGNGSIVFTFTNVPDGNYTISYDAGTFANVAVSSGVATVVAAKGTYDNLNITVSGCTSVEDVDITLTDPPTPTIAAVGTDPATCGGNGSIAFTFTNVPDGNYTISYDAGTFANVAVSSGAATVVAAKGTYDNLNITVSGCTSVEDVDITLTDPPTPTIAAVGTDPATCGGNGSIVFTFTNVPDGNYTISYDAGTFANVAVSSGAATVVAAQGTYDNLNITVSGCTSAEDVDITLTDPPTPTIAAVGTDPATCGGNGSIAFTFTNVPDGNYTITYDAGSFTNVAVASNTATVATIAGTYNNLKITVHGCTSIGDPDIVLSDPGTPVIVLGTISNASTCSGSDASIQITGLSPSTLYDVDYTDDTSPVSTTLSSDGTGIVTIATLDAGVYDAITATLAGCQSNAVGPVTLSDPALPTLSATGTNPATCGGNGSIAFTFTNVPDGNYTISYDAGTFANVAVSSGLATVVAAKGTYDNLNITASGCTSAEDVDITLTDPPTPTIAAVGTDPATCGGNGSIAFTFTNVPDGNYTISYDAGTFANVAVSSGAATVVAAQGTYDNLNITVSGCTSAEDVDITLTDPPLPTIAAVSTDPATCGGNGSIAFTFTNVPDGNYTISYDAGTFANVAVSSGAATVVAAKGTYDNLNITVSGCTSAEDVDITLTDPPTPTIAAVGTDPATCGGNGSIAFTFTNVPDGNYTINYDAGTFANVAVSSGAAMVVAAQGTYDNLNITVSGCTSAEDVDITLTDPPTPTIAAVGTDPATCGGNGSIAFTFTNVPDGNYTISYDAGTFANVAVSSGVATVVAAQGTYDNLNITVSGCTSAEDVDITLTDPPTPTLAADRHRSGYLRWQRQHCLYLYECTGW
jgi:hypothetical protein